MKSNQQQGMISSIRKKVGLTLCLLVSAWIGLGGIGWSKDSSAPSVSSSMTSIHKALTVLAEGPMEEKKGAVAFLLEHADPSLLPELEELRVNVGRRVRRLMKPLISLLRNKEHLASENQENRRAAARDLGMHRYPQALLMLETALAHEKNRWVRYDLEEAKNLIHLDHADPTVRLAAITKLGEMRSAAALPILKKLSEVPGTNLEQHTLAHAAQEASQQIKNWQDIAIGIETLLQGLSLSSILLIMALGLAIVFGLMGVINMAHGEMMMTGAYATFITQELFRAHLPESMFDYYFVLALPCAFGIAALFGWILEITLIRFLYGRPLETLLATWGVGLVMIQGARIIFGDLTAVQAPSWLRGQVQVMVGVQIPWNRLFIIFLATACVIGIYLLLFRTGTGLRVRAVLQNRDMSACLGIPTRKLDAYTFAFGSGLAGLAGSALTLVGNVDPELGRNYIVDSFMVVVTGGVGKLAGTITAALGIGTLTKLLEPGLGAVYGKVMILVLIILFLQFRPSGLFTLKGRRLDS